MSQRGRPPGALNKPKFINVSLSTLNAKLQANAVIPVDIKFAAALSLVESSEPLNFNNRILSENQIEKIEINKIEF